jgi:hypothetical protein
VPRVVKPGQTVMLTVKAVLPTGAGQVRWRPETGPPISSKDFDVEIDQTRRITDACNLPPRLTAALPLLEQIPWSRR